MYLYMLFNNNKERIRVQQFDPHLSNKIKQLCWVLAYPATLCVVLTHPLNHLYQKFCPHYHGKFRASHL